jgi:hypothetical protein
VNEVQYERARSIGQSTSLSTAKPKRNTPGLPCQPASCQGGSGSVGLLPAAEREVRPIVAAPMASPPSQYDGGALLSLWTVGLPDIGGGRGHVGVCGRCAVGTCVRVLRGCKPPVPPEGNQVTRFSSLCTPAQLRV